MRKLFLVIVRECRIRLRKPAFWVLTLLVPAILACLYALPVLTAGRSVGPATVLVVDQTGLFQGHLRSTDEVAFRSFPTLEEAQQQADKTTAILYIPLRQTTIPRDAFLLYQADEPPLAVQSAVDAQLQTLLRNAILEDVYHLEPSVYHSVEATHIRLHTQDAVSGRESFVVVKNVVAIALAALMLIALTLFGIQVMRAVQEERQNRVAEVIASSVKPVQLLGGKVAGIALTATLQLGLWIALTGCAIWAIQSCNSDLFDAASASQLSVASKGAAATAQYEAGANPVNPVMQGLAAIHLPLVALAFLLSFLLGYMLYGALLAAVAARLDSDADSVGWTLVVVSPLAATVMLAPLLLRAPSGALAAWLTLIPFTAPAAAMLRLPFGLPVWQVLVAVIIIIISAAAASLLAARVYRRRIVR